MFAVAASDGLTVYRLTLVDMVGICELQRETDLDFDDATLVHAAQVLDQDRIIAINEHLDHDGEFEYERLHPKEY